MGRFTSVQIISDNHSSNRTITYDQARGASASVGGGEGSIQNKDNKDDKGSSNNNNNSNERLVTEKVVNPYGSTSGAGSGEFHVYRHARAREAARWNALDAEASRRAEEEGFRASLEADRAAVERRAEKNRRKRQREKDARKRKKHLRAAGIGTDRDGVGGSAGTNHKSSSSNNSSSIDDEEFTYVPLAEQRRIEEKAKETDADAGQLQRAPEDKPEMPMDIPTDGSFLEVMKRKLEEEQRAAKERTDNENENGNGNNEEQKQGPAPPFPTDNNNDDDDDDDSEGPVPPPGV